MPRARRDGRCGRGRQLQAAQVTPMPVQHLFGTVGGRLHEIPGGPVQIIHPIPDTAGRVGLRPLAETSPPACGEAGTGGCRSGDDQDLAGRDGLHDTPPFSPEHSVCLVREVSCGSLFIPPQCGSPPAGSRRVSGTGE